jgi:hypothetical protein
MNVQHKQLSVDGFVESYLENATSHISKPCSLRTDGFGIIKADEWKASSSTLLRRRRLGSDGLDSVGNIDQHLNLVSSWIVSFDMGCADSVNVVPDMELHVVASTVNDALRSKDFRDKFGTHVLGGVVDASSVSLGTSSVSDVVVKPEPRVVVDSVSDSRRLLDFNQVKGKESVSEVVSGTSLVIVRTFCPWDFDKLISSFDDWVKFPPCGEDEIGVLSKKPDMVLFFSGSFDQWSDIKVSMDKVVDDFNAGRFAWGHCFDKMHFDTANLSPSEDRLD